MKNFSLHHTGKILFTLSVALVFLMIPLMTYAIERVSVSSAGVEGNDASEYASISSDGRYVVFSSSSDTFDPLDLANGYGESDVFLHDRDLGTTTMISKSTAGVQGNQSSDTAKISGNGRYVVFDSDADNLVAVDTNGDKDLFLYDHTAGSVELISKNSGGVIGNGQSERAYVSGDGQFVVFETHATNFDVTDTNGLTDFYVLDRVANTLEQIVGNGGAQPDGGPGDDFGATISDDGRYVVFSSEATNIVPGDVNGLTDVFVHDRTTGINTRISEDSLGNGGNSNSEIPFISADGRYISFSSDADNLVAGDTNGQSDVFSYDQNTGILSILFPALGSFLERTSSDGRYSSAVALITGDANGQPDVFRHDRTTSSLQRVSVDTSNTEANMGGFISDISDDGCHIVFGSESDNLVPLDTNGENDIFVVTLCTTTPTVTPLSTTSTTPTITGTWDNEDATELSITVGGTTYTLASPELDTTTTPGTWSLDLSAAGLTPGPYEVLATNNNQFATEDDTSSLELQITSVTPPTSTPKKGGSVKYICEDPDATNYDNSGFGRHKDSLCEYEDFACTDPEALNYDDSDDLEHKQSECEYAYDLDIESNLEEGSVQENNISSTSNSCPIFTQHMKKGDKDGYQAQSKQETGVSTTINEVKLLQQTLLEQGFNPGAIDGHYGNKTAQAVGQWQTKHTQQVLTPWNITNSTNWFYQSSERWMNELLGCEDDVVLDTGVVLTERYTG